MIIQLHRPGGIIEVDSETVTDKELMRLGITREGLNRLIPVDTTEEIAKLKARLKELEAMVKALQEIRARL